ncbi:MAG: hypothetical protein FJ318_07050, partial [SAR202 cluster bacterium]|nr:hypothetical protein [SAR202 cluster bacterium]
AHHADNVVVVDNDRILDTKRNLPARKAFRMADEILRLGVQSVAELVAVPGDIIVDFDDLRGVMLADRWAALGTGSGGGPNGLMQATRSALNSPLLSGHIGAARGILVNFRTRAQAAVPEVREASEAVRAAVAPNCNVITALITEAGMQVGAEVTIIAVGIRPFGFEDADNAPPPAEVAALLEMVDRLEEALGAYERRDAGSPAKSVLNGALDSAIGYVEASTRITLTKKVVVGRAKVRQVLDALRPAARAKPALAGDAMDPMLAGLLGELRRRAQALAEPRRTPSMAGD